MTKLIDFIMVRHAEARREAARLEARTAFLRQPICG
jgi:hypothetical protein